MNNLLNFDSTPYSDNLPGATTQLINQPDVVGSNVIISEESDLVQTGGKKSRSKSTKKTKSSKSTKSTKSSKSSKSTKSAKSTKSTKSTKSKSAKSKSAKSKSVKSVKKEKEIDKYKRSYLEKIAKKNKVSLKKRDGTLKNKLELFKSLKRKNLL